MEPEGFAAMAQASVDIEATAAGNTAQTAFAERIRQFEERPCDGENHEYPIF